MGCPELVDDFIVDVEINHQSFKSFYEAGQQSRQAEIDELQKRIDEIENHVGVNYDCGRDDDRHSYWSGYNQALREIFEMLKGVDNK